MLGADKSWQACTWFSPSGQPRYLCDSSWPEPKTFFSLAFYQHCPPKSLHFPMVTMPESICHRFWAIQPQNCSDVRVNGNAAFHSCTEYLNRHTGLERSQAIFGNLDKCALHLLLLFTAKCCGSWASSLQPFYLQIFPHLESDRSFSRKKQQHHPIYCKFISFYSLITVM